MSPQAYSIYTRRIKVQLSERIIRSVEVIAERDGKSFRRVMEDLLQDALDDLCFALSPEDERIVLERAQKNLECREKGKRK
jgi:hypothetical protein